MIFSEKFFFGEQILKSQYRKLRGQLEKGTFESKKVYWVIVLNMQGSNLFECISTNEFCMRREREDAYIVSGIIHEMSEFPLFVKGVIEQLLTSNQAINKQVLIKWLIGD